jgi:hypothetical protein
MRRLVVPVPARQARCVGLGLGGKRGEAIDFSGIRASGFRHGLDDEISRDFTARETSRSEPKFPSEPLLRPDGLQTQHRRPAT